MKKLVREAINRELARGGQVYYVYNRVTDIADVAAKIAELVPEATVAFCPWTDERAGTGKDHVLILSTERSMCWFPPRSLRRDWISPMSIP